MTSGTIGGIFCEGYVDERVYWTDVSLLVQAGPTITFRSFFLE